MTFEVFSDTDQPAQAPARFLGLAFDLLDVGQVAERLIQRPALAPFAYVVTPNVDHVVRLHDEPVPALIDAAYHHAAITLCDSQVLALLARLRGVVLKVAAGSDVTECLLARLAHTDAAITIIGGDALTVPRLAARYGLANVAQHVPPMGLLANEAAQEAAVDFILAHPARYVFLAVGSPQQEVIAYKAMLRGGATGVGLCVGASLDYLTGRAHRAPALFRRFALEWLYRLLCEPRRLWRRYLVRSPRIFSLLRRDD